MAYNSKGNKAETMILSGKGLYTRLFQPDSHPQWGSKWGTTLLLDNAETERAKDAQLQVKYKAEYGGKFPGFEGNFIRINRPTVKSKFAGGGPNEAPEVIDVHSVPLDPYTLIGDGSDLKVKFIVKSGTAESIKKYGGKSTWLIKVQVTNLVKGSPAVGSYFPDADFMEDSSEWGSSIASPKGSPEAASSPFDSKATATK